MKIVVIGGTGLIGSNVVAKLRQKGHDVNAASPSNPTRPLDQRSITTWATWSR